MIHSSLQTFYDNAAMYKVSRMKTQTLYLVLWSTISHYIGDKKLRQLATSLSKEINRKIQLRRIFNEEKVRQKKHSIQKDLGTGINKI